MSPTTRHLEAWLEEFNARPSDERTAFLGPLLEENPELATAEFVNDGSVIAAVNPGRRDTYRAMREERDQPCSCGHPAVWLEPHSALADAAASTVTMRRLAFLGEWCQPGRKVEKHSGPVGVELASLCEQFGIDTPPAVKIRTPCGTCRRQRRPGSWRCRRTSYVKGAHAPSPAHVPNSPTPWWRAKRTTKAALELWLEAFHAAIIDEDLETEAAQLADSALKAVLAALYNARGPITLADVEHALEIIMPDWVDDNDVPVLIAAEIAEAIELFRRLHHCGAITITATGEPGSVDRPAGLPATAGEDRRHTHAPGRVRHARIPPRHRLRSPHHKRVNSAATLLTVR